MAQSPSRLSQLWLTRDSLGAAERVELYSLLQKLLRPVARSICANLPETPEDCIQQFALDHVLDLKPSHKLNFQFLSDLETEGYIRTLFRSLVTSKRRGSAREIHKTDYVDAEELDQHATPSADGAVSVVETLAAAGMSAEEATEKATKFLETLHPDEKIFLVHHTCMDYDDKQAERKFGKAAVPLSTLAVRFDIKNYYRKAKELGITGTRAGYVADFAQSKLGRWMKQCGLRVEKDRWSEMMAMLQILCGTAFLEAENERDQR